MGSYKMKMRYLALIGLLLAVHCPARTIRVDDDGPADFNTIQAAIDDANDGDVVLVAPGTYTGDGNRDIDFNGKAITVKSEEGPETSIIECQGSRDEFHRGFYFHSGEDANSVVQGFTIANGYARGGRGGGLYCSTASPRIVDCIITGNTARDGGGIACFDSNSVIVGCIIYNNLASIWPSSWFSQTDGDGGGIAIRGDRNGNTPILANCLIVGNRASRYGGGISCAGNPVFTNCTICGNRTGTYGRGGGIAPGAGDWNRGTLLNCIVWANAAWVGEQIGHMTGGILGEMRLEILSCALENSPNAIDDPMHRIEGEWISRDPLFVQLGSWEPYEPNSAPPGLIDYLWIQGDYHLKSQAGRWDSESQSWVKDDVTSPCIDAGDPMSPIGHEVFPNGGIINIGAYGGTAEASKSYFGEPVCETIVAGDINGDCKVDVTDFALMAAHWLEEN
jgi:hypothetical protein